jgi:hypothetical protein
MAIDDKKQYRTEAQEWYFRLINKPYEFEKMRYIDSINVYNSVIGECQKLYDKTPASDRFTRARSLNGIKRAQIIYWPICGYII